MKITRQFAVLLAVAVVTLLGASADAQQLAKKGTFSGVLGWHFPAGQYFEIEKDHIIWGGVFSGMFREDAGEGFLHGAVAVCTGSGELKKSSIISDVGNCVLTDQDGDKAFMKWKCTGCSFPTNNGEQEWTGGTGKYTGLKGHHTYHVTASAGPTGFVGASAWKGEWELP